MAEKRYSTSSKPSMILEHNKSSELELVPDEFTKAQLDFNKATFELGLYLIDEYKAGRYDDKTLDAIIKIMEVQPKAIRRE